MGITKHTRIPAVDGNNLRNYKLNIPQEYYNTHSNNEIACTSSHLKCIEKAYYNKNNITIKNNHDDDNDDDINGRKK